jgi:hypothetical protein
MNDLSFQYRTEGRHVLIEMELNSARQLFNTLDPSPFYEKDMDADAEDYIIDSAMEINVRKPLALIMHLPPEEIPNTNVDEVRDAIHHYFKYRTLAVQRDLRLVMQQGRWSLLIGLLILASCIVIRSLIPLLHLNELTSEILSEGFLISGWVTMWRPFQIFVYDWWPFRHQIRVLQKLSRIRVEVRPSKHAVKK